MKLTLLGHDDRYAVEQLQLVQAEKGIAQISNYQADEHGAEQIEHGTDPLIEVREICDQKQQQKEDGVNADGKHQSFALFGFILFHCRLLPQARCLRFLPQVLYLWGLMPGESHDIKADGPLPVRVTE